jgi:hypothetical protein
MLRVFEKWMLRRIFGPKRDEVTEEWRKLHNEDCLGDKIKKHEMGGACSVYGREESHIQGFGGGKGPLGRSRYRWEDNIKTDL